MIYFSSTDFISIFFSYWFILPFNDNGRITPIGGKTHTGEMKKKHGFKLIPCIYFLIFIELNGQFLSISTESILIVSALEKVAEFAKICKLIPEADCTEQILLNILLP